MMAEKHEADWVRVPSLTRDIVVEEVSSGAFCRLPGEHAFDVFVSGIAAHGESLWDSSDPADEGWLVEPVLQQGQVAT